MKLVNIVQSKHNKTHMTKTQTQTLQAIRETKGRFFGLTTKNGVYNAQFRGETPSYVTIYDRNARKMRKFAKASLVAVNAH